MTPNPRIHRPNARSYVPTITQSTALWKAMRHREQMEHRREALRAELAANPLLVRLKNVLRLLPFLRGRV
jgi:hypothetical protein